MAGEFDDLPTIKKPEDYEATGLFDDLPSVTSRFKGVFDDIKSTNIPKLSDQEIKKLAGTYLESGEYVPPEVFKDTESMAAQYVAAGIARPIEFAFAVPSGLDNAFWTMQKALWVEGKGPIEALMEGKRAYVRTASDWARPIGQEQAPQTLPSEVGGLSGLPGLASNLILQPSNLIFSGTIGKILRGGQRAQSALEMATTAKGAKIAELYPERALTGTVKSVGKKGITVNEPMELPRVIDTTVTPGSKLPVIVEQKKAINTATDEVAREITNALGKKKEVSVNVDQLMGKTHAEKIVGKKLKVVEVGAEKGSRMPDWVTEGLTNLRYTTDRMFNNMDLSNPSVREAIQMDPTLSAAQKAKILSKGSVFYGDEIIYRLVDDAGTIYSEVGLKAHPQYNALEIAWFNASKSGINVEKGRMARMFYPVDRMPGYWREVHHKLEIYAKDKGFKVIGASPKPEGITRLRAIGFQQVADDLMGIVPYSHYKRIDMNINFEAPNFFEKIRNLKIFQKVGYWGQDRAKLVYDSCKLRNMSFDLTSDGKWTFYDRYLQPIQKFDNLDQCEDFVSSIRLSDKNYLMQIHRYNDAEQQFNLAARNYQDRIAAEAKKASDLGTEEFYAAVKGTKEPGLITYRKFLKEEPPPTGAAGGAGGAGKPPPTLSAGGLDAGDDAKAVFDIGKGEVVAVSGNVPIKESYLTALQKIRDIKDFYSTVLTGKNWLMIPLHVFERQGKEIKEMFYRRIKIAERRETQEIRNLERETNALGKSLGLNNKNYDRVGYYAMAQDPVGKATLINAMKKTVPELTPNEMKFYEFMRSKYEDYFKRINEARVFAGLDPIEYRGDYFTFFRNYDELERLGYFLNSPEFSAQYQNFVHRVSTSFAHEKLRKGGLIEIQSNAKDVFLRYARSSAHHIHMTPPIAIDRALLKKIKLANDKTFDVQQTAPQFHAWMQRWLDDVAGQRANTRIPQWVERAAVKLNTNITYAFLSYNLRSALIQPTAIWNAYSELGNRYLMEGIRDWLTNANNAVKKSNVLITREYEQAASEAFKMVREPGYLTKLSESLYGAINPTARVAKRGGQKIEGEVIFPTMRKVSRTYTGGKQAVARIGMKPLQMLDQTTASICWNGAYKKAKNYLKMGEQEAINYADDMVTRTQGSGKVSDLADIQRNIVGKSMLSLQTFVNNNWGFLMRDVLGVSNPTLKNKDRFMKIAKLLIGIEITNFVFEDIFQTYSPFPTPVRAYLETVAEGGSPAAGAVAGLTEIGEIIPGIGGAIRYGSHPFGPLAETVSTIPEVLHGRPGVKSPEQLVGTLLGIPATSQAKKIGVGLKHGASLMEMLLGMKKAPKKSKKGSMDIESVGKIGEVTLR